jgi:hypothetical protein
MRAATSLLLLALASTGCGKKPSRTTPDAGVGLAPLAAESWLVTLPGGARASVPLGAQEPRPLLVALPGAVDRPEWECGSWRGISRARPFVLCPPSADEPALRAALKELKQRFGRHLAKGPVVLTAVGASAEAALRLWREEPAFFARVVLIEGTHPSLGSTEARGIVERGGRTVLWVCADPDCRARAERDALFFRSAGGMARVLPAPAESRGLDGRLAAALEQEWGWITQGDSRYSR